MAVTFFAATKIEECRGNREFVQFDEDIHLAIYNERNNLPTESSVLYSLDPYGLEILSIEKVCHLKDISQKLLIHFEKSKEISDFLKKLKVLCIKAIHENKNIISLGD